MAARTRRAFVAGPRGSHAWKDQLERYLPANYRVVGGAHERDGLWGYTIEGHDVAGWTLDGYVIPRLQSGLYGAHEIPAGESRRKRLRGHAARVAAHRRQR